MPKKAAPKQEAHWEESKHPRATDGRFGDKPGEHDKKPATKKPAAKKASEDKKGAGKDEKKTPKPSGKSDAGSAGTKPSAKPKPASGKSAAGKTTGTASSGKQKAEITEPKELANLREKMTPKEFDKFVAKMSKMTDHQLWTTAMKTFANSPLQLAMREELNRRKNAAKEPEKPAPKTSEVKKPATKKEPAKAPAKAPAPAPKEKKPAAKPKGKSVKDIRSEAQANRELAYDVGDKVGGARKDLFQQSFYNNPTPKTLEDLEKMAPELAQVVCKKENILKKIDFEAEFKRGTEVNVAFLKQMIYDRIAPKPSKDTPESRMAYLSGINELHRILAPIKSYEQMNGAIRELSTIARAGKRLAEANDKLNSMNNGRYSYINEGYYKEAKEKGEAAKKQMDFEALGDKLENFFTSSDAYARTLTTLRGKKLSWDTYFTPSEAEAKTKAPKGAQKKRWERAAVNEHMRTGGKETTVKKPEDMVKQFNLKGVEFGHWVDDSAGLFHLKRSAEAFQDLAETLGVDDKDISLNGRLSMAFGARGSGGALAHYEPARKVINMTKFGGAGSLAHEWGHALDNIMYQYSNGGAGSLNMASEGGMGDHDDELKLHYDVLMDTIMNPVPGEKGGTKKITLDSSAKITSNYYPEMRRDAQGGMGADDLYKKWHEKLVGGVDREIRVINSSQFRSQEDKDKKTKSLLRKKTQILNELPHYIASEMRYATVPDWKTNPEAHYRGEIEVSTGKSEYMTRMEEMDGSAKSYYAQPAEMFARVFESYVEDKLKAKKRKNNYLVWGTAPTPEAPFPIGAERVHMHTALEALLDHIVGNKALKKALDMELRKSFGEPTKRYAYSVPKPEEAIYIPVNRLKMVYQTEAATNWDKVKENMERMRAGDHLEPVVIGLDHDVHDGHHRWLAAKALDHTHVPCVVGATDDMDKQVATDRYRELWKSFDASEARDERGRWTMLYHTTDNKDFTHDPTFDNKQQELGRGLYVSPGNNLLYWHKALKGTSGSSRKYVIPIDASKANIVHASEMPDQRQMSKDIITHYGGDTRRALAKVHEESPTGDTFGADAHQIAVRRTWAKVKGYHGIASNDGTEGDQVVLFDDSAVHYQPAMDIDEFIQKERHGLLKSVFDRLDLIKAKTFDESKHPRASDGKFGTKAAPKTAKEPKSEPKAKKPTAPKSEAKATASEDKVTLFHGTKVAHAETIMQKGFKAQRSGNGDMGKCAYFKSPEWDKKEADDFAKTKRAVNYFAGHDADDSGGEAPIPGRVIKAVIDRKHILDCSKGRPQELQDMIDEFKRDKTRYSTPRWDKNSSPYEAYAKKHGIKVIIDKLDTAWADEGWQIGVYDPKIIQIMDVGKKLVGEGAKLKLQKSASEADAPYCLLHHEFTEDGNLVLHIGAQ